jgi:ATP-dependent DNA helicase RecQ
MTACLTLVPSECDTELALATELPSPSLIQQGLRVHFGLEDFRPRQAEVVSAVLSGRNTVVVMPTGAGKSLCYQLPAMLLEGLTLVVSPLIALMQDQVDALTARGIAATFINSTLSDTQRLERQRAMRAGAYKLVYVAPERFRSEAFVAALLEARLALYAIDEAHCISQWGHDFRPDYALLGRVRQRLRPPRTVALTATATPEVRDDIVRVLLMKDPLVCVAGFDRPNLYLEVAQVSGDEDKRQAAAGLVEEGGSGLVYCNTRKQAETLHQALKRRHTHTVLYHAGLDDEARRAAQEEFMAHADSVAVATNAFGMGIDKADIRFVAHAGIPRAVEAYYQEIGRAGRDGLPAHAVLLFNHADVYTQERLIQSNFPAETLLADLWAVLREFETFDHGVNQLAGQLGASEFEVSSALRVLEREGLVFRGGRGEGRYEITLLPGAGAQRPRNTDAKALLASLTAAFAEGARASTELTLLARRAGLDAEQTRHALGLLEKAGALLVKKPFAGRAIAISRHESWSDLAIDLTRWRRQENQQLLMLKRMTDYAYTTRCRRSFILRYFGEETPATRGCGSCDVCAGRRLARDQSAARRAPKAATPRALAGSEARNVLAVEELRRWRRELSKDLGVPPFIIFNDETLYGLASALPITEAEFLRVKGTGPARWERFGPKVVEICLLARAVGPPPMRGDGAGRQALG